MPRGASLGGADVTVSFNRSNPSGFAGANGAQREGGEPPASAAESMEALREAQRKERSRRNSEPSPWGTSIIEAALKEAQA